MESQENVIQKGEQQNKSYTKFADGEREWQDNFAKNFVELALFFSFLPSALGINLFIISLVAQNFSTVTTVITCIISISLTIATSAFIFKPKLSKTLLTRSVKFIRSRLPKPRRKKPTPTLPRTWGQELLLLAHKKNRQQVWRTTPIKQNIIKITLGSIIGAIIGFCIALARSDKTIEFDLVLKYIIYLYSTCFALLCFVGMIYYLIQASRALLPIYFQRLADRKNEERESKMKAFHKQLPENKYRVASLTPPKDAEQVRALLETDHPLSHEQRAKAKALLEAQDELDEAQTFAKLAAAQTKTTTS